MPTPSDDTVQQPVSLEDLSQATCPPDSSRSGDWRTHETVSSQRDNAPSIPSSRRSSSASAPISSRNDSGSDNDIDQRSQMKPEAVEESPCLDAPSPMITSMGSESKDGEPSLSLELALTIPASTIPSSFIGYKTSDVRVRDNQLRGICYR
jgi:hypothetical protein